MMTEAEARAMATTLGGRAEQTDWMPDEWTVFVDGSDGSHVVIGVHGVAYFPDRDSYDAGCQTIWLPFRE